MQQISYTKKITCLSFCLWIRHTDLIPAWRSERNIDDVKTVEPISSLKLSHTLTGIALSVVLNLLGHSSSEKLFGLRKDQSFMDTKIWKHKSLELRRNRRLSDQISKNIKVWKLKDSTNVRSFIVFKVSSFRD